MDDGAAERQAQRRREASSQAGRGTSGCGSVAGGPSLGRAEAAQEGTASPTRGTAPYYEHTEWAPCYEHTEWGPLL